MKKRKLHILIVEDNPISQMISAAMLRELGHASVAAGTLAEARERLESVVYDAILLDSQLPDGEGVDLARRYRKRGGDIPIIAVTGGVDSAEHREACKEAGMTDYLSKPYTLEQLSKVLETPAVHAAAS